MVEEKHVMVKGVFAFVPLTFRNAGKGEIAIRDEEGKEISLDKLWERYVPIGLGARIGKTDSYGDLWSKWINLDIELLDYTEEEYSNLVKENIGGRKHILDEPYENMEEDEEDETKDIKIITKTDRGMLFVRPYSLIDRLGWSGKVIIGYYEIWEFADIITGKGSLSLSQLLEKFIGREVILNLRMEASDEDKEEEYF